MSHLPAAAVFGDVSRLVEVLCSPSIGRKQIQTGHKTAVNYSTLKQEIDQFEFKNPIAVKEKGKGNKI